MAHTLSTPADAWAFFPGWVPPFAIFDIHLESLAHIVALRPESENASSLLPSLCVIGLVAYFEAFCKEQFASIVNICPNTLRNFVDKRPAVSIRVKDFLHMTDMLQFRLGSVIADEYDFGSAKLINGLFRDLISVTPFSVKDARIYQQLLKDRNLLVHHGGTYTLRYAYEAFPTHDIPSKVYDYGIAVGKDEFLESSSFLRRIAKKLARACRASFLRFATQHKIVLNGAQHKAVDYMVWEIDSEAEH